MTTNIVVRNIGGGAAKNITFEFYAPLKSTSGWDITDLPYFQNGINFMAPQTNLPSVWDSCQNVVQTLRDAGLTEGITITSKSEDLQEESYEAAWTINPLLLEGSGYSDYKEYEDQVQALQDQARALERIAENIKQAIDHSRDGQTK